MNKLILLALLAAAVAYGQNTGGGGGNVTGGQGGTGTPVVVGGTDGTSTTTLRTDSNGALISNSSSAPTDNRANNSSQPLVLGASLPLGVYPYTFNGSTWDRNYYCTNSAVVNVTNGTTGQLVALTSGQTIRVCGIVLTSTAATTATLSYGTGTTCGTGNTPLSGAMALGASTAPLTISLGADGALRTAASNALCLAAGATSVAGFITYAKY